MRLSFRGLAPYLILIAFLVLAFWKILFAGQTFRSAQWGAGVTPIGPYHYPGYGTQHEMSFYTFGGDPPGSGWQIVSEEEKALQEILKGNFPLWNNNQMFGMQLAHNMQLSTFFPLKAMMLLSRTDGMWDFYKLLLFLFAGVFTYLYLELIGLTFISRMIGALSFMLSGFLVMYVHFSFMDVQVQLPFLLYSVERWIRGPSARNVGLMATAFGLSFLCGYPVPVFLAVFFACAYGAFRLFELRRENGKRLSRLGLGMATGALIGLGIGALVVFPGIQTLVTTENTRPPGMGLGTVSLKFIYASFLPYILTFLKPENYFVWCGWHGLMAGVLALVAIFQRPKPIVFFFTLFAIGAYLKLGGVPPFQWIAYLPMFNRTIFTRYIHPEIAFCVAILAAFGAERLIKKQISLRAAASIALGLVGVCLLLFFSQRGLFKEVAGPERLFKWMGGFTLLFVLWSFAYYRSWVSAKTGGILLLLLTGLELVSHTQARRNQRYNPFTPAPYIQFLKSQPAIVNHEARTLGLDGNLHPPYSSGFDIDDVRWMNATHFSYYRRYVNEFISASRVDRWIGDEKDQKLFGPDYGLTKYLDLANVRYVLSSKPLELKSDRSPLKLVFDKDIKVYENTRALPRVFVIHRLLPVDNDDSAVAAMKADGFDPAREAVVHLPSSRSVEVEASGKGSAKIVSYESTRVTIRASTDRPGFLVFTDAYYSKWIAKIDGKETPVYRTDLAFRGIALPPGMHLLTFEYRDKLFIGSLVVSIASILASLWLLKG